MSTEDAFLRVWIFVFFPLSHPTLVYVHLPSPPSPTNLLQISFKLFDLNGDGSITLDEFKEIIRLHTLAGDSACLSGGAHKESEEYEDLSNAAVFNNLAEAFGDEGNKRLNYQEFIELLKSLNNEVLIQQFKVWSA